MSDEELRTEPDAGRVLVLDVGVAGVAPVPFIPAWEKGEEKGPGLISVPSGAPPAFSKSSLATFPNAKPSLAATSSTVPQ